MKRVLIYILFIIVFSSCEKALIKPDPENNPVNNFDYLWTNLYERYSFFEYKGINWSEIYLKYRPHITNEIHDTTLFRVMSEMLYELKDGHVNLSSPFDVSRNWEWYLGYPQNFSWEIIERNYLYGDYRITGAFRNKILDENIGYIYYPSFANTVNNYHISFLFNEFKDTEGIIIDIRNNGGGSLSNAKLIASRLVEDEHTAGYSYVKNGPEKDDFVKGNDFIIEPVEDVIEYSKPIVVLTNRSSYSASSFFVLFVKDLTNVTIIGDTTGGGGGLPISGELPNGWTYRFSSTITTDINGFNIENGIPPHIKRDISESDRLSGVDSILEEAISFIKNNTFFCNT
jgi:hypothetical protein